jgi:disulfide bond formation protein DsbB
MAAYHAGRKLDNALVSRNRDFENQLVVLMNQWERHCNALIGILLSAVLWGALAIQFFKHETPCPLCYLQRAGMLGVASGALMNVKFGSRRAHYGLSLLFSLFGGFVALRQISLHVCPGFSAFGIPFWGLSLYTWSFIVFAISVLVIALLMMIFDKREAHTEQLPSYWLGDTAFFTLFCVTLVNICAVVWQCGIGPCADV